MQRRPPRWTGRLAVAVLGLGVALAPAGRTAFALSPGSGTVRLPTTVEQVGLTTSLPRPDPPPKPAHRVVRNTRHGVEIVGFGRPPAPTSSTVIPAPPAGPPCEWLALGKPWLCG